jgi:hypothetical protein
LIPGGVVGSDIKNIHAVWVNLGYFQDTFVARYGMIYEDEKNGMILQMK